MRGPSSPGDLSAQHIPAVINNSSARLLHNPLHPPGGICTLSLPAAKAAMWGLQGISQTPPSPSLPWGRVGNIIPGAAAGLKLHAHIG